MGVEALMRRTETTVKGTKKESRRVEAPDIGEKEGKRCSSD